MTTPSDSKEPFLPWIIAVALGGASALMHLAGPHDIYDFAFKGTRAIGQLILYAAPLFLGILAGITYRKGAAQHALVLTFLTLTVAAPLMMQDLICLIVIVPVYIVVAPITAWLTSLVANARRRQRAGHVGVEMLLLLIPITGALMERLVPPPLPEPVELVDSVVVDVPRGDVWRSLDTLHFSFEATEAPWAVRTLMPVPLGIEGRGARVGAERKVIFSHGVVTAQVIRSAPPESFAFRLAVTESSPGFLDHFALLGDSQFLLEEVSPHRTRVTHRTSYRPLAYPRWYFAPVERWLGGLTQRYMLEAYASSLKRDAQVAQR